MVATEQESLDRAISLSPPKPEVTLVGWVLMAEWAEPSGDRFLSRMLSGSTTPWQVKGYLHEGLNTSWPFNPGHHNPGHPVGWMRVTDARS